MTFPDHPLLETGCRMVVGHRGNALHAPENTLVSIEQAVVAGADAVEIDVHLSADGEAVVIHDPTVARTTGAAGVVASLDVQALQRLDAGATFTRDAGLTHPYRDRGIVVPTLAEVLHSFPDMPFVIELKTAAAQPRVLRVLRDAGAERRSIVAAFDIRAVRALRVAGLRTGASRGEIAALLARSAVGRVPLKHAFDAVFMPQRFRGLPLAVGRLARATEVGKLPIHIWVENEPAIAAALWDRGICGIVTDDPGTLVATRRSLK